VKLVAELQPGVTTETEVARIERDEQANLAELGLRLEEAKQLTAALQAQIVPAQLAVLSECRRSCVACGSVLASKGHCPVRFRSLFGDVPLRIRRLLTCPCQGDGEAKSSAILGFDGNAVAPELTYLTARYAALAPFGKVAALLSDLLPISETQHASTVRNRMRRVGETIVQQRHSADTAKPVGPVVIGLDGGYVRSCHGGEGRHFEVIAGKVADAEGTQHRFAFVRNDPVAASDAFKQVLAAAGVGADTPATVLCDGDAGLWRLQRAALPQAMVCRTGGTPRCVLNTRCRLPAALALALPIRTSPTRRSVAWSGPSGACGTAAGRDAGANLWPSVAGRGANRCVTWPGPDVSSGTPASCLGHLERNQGALVHYAARRRRGEPISTAFVESAVNEIVARRMNKKQQMRWSRTRVQPFLDVRTAVLDGTLEDAFRRRHHGFRPANDERATAVTA
jgi:hypothetical protein